ncbi:hypothetical protein ABB37_09116 [Leptomonas pyrrhocoris]|uniref:Uncharacterized protein n=1 Tax=Leptomonas pyrrhocoris TaxID=157538 RepID=A0A0M9FRJ5_LEPPY|nr:hypothetical protein ABB37_09116 [Leptomonas pyrrhocoris]XP_015652855.1 hypothetical protein ABB37_09116 [Leptomonas pyrrhocoris]KPA74415.1 hypothetical protein ABB37_09116 [Leptomonas pyrrhocoris]KPA74416.1 hypothetical protein ABB37_09116 [Leptomonas pyrrhocoris]|eukprot:XP_015652854.1 hypothetical protein ABB37_09116 [Leptomonas pyrrhocoris]
MKTKSTKRQRTASVDESKPERAAKKVVVSSSLSPAAPLASASASGAAPSAAPTTAATLVPSAATPQPCKNALLVVSTYHAVMAGLVYRKNKFFIKFSVKRHVGQVRATAVTERYIASCGVDERVFLFTNKAEERLTAAARRKMKEAGEPLAVRLADLGSLAPPAEVTAIAFADGSQALLCGCADGQLLLYRCRDWSLATTLTVHEKAVVGLAVHPGSRGSLAVTIGEDRAIAVLDLVKGKLLTKWKYTPTVATADAEAGEKEEKKEKGVEDAPSSRGAARTVFAPARETPDGIHFSLSGTRFVIFSRFSFVVYDAAVMRPLCTFRWVTPQPPHEIHCCTFLTEALLVVGTEAGALRQFAVRGTVEEPMQTVGELPQVEVEYPEALMTQAAELLATPVKAEMESRQKNPLRHVCRVKALQADGATLFSIDSSGIVIAWNVQADSATATVRAQYVTSANCQGRVTGMELYPL